MEICRGRLSKQLNNNDGLKVDEINIFSKLHLYPTVQLLAFHESCIPISDPGLCLTLAEAATRIRYSCSNTPF